MNTSFLKQLKSNLLEQTWPWVISALRQDVLVWETLQLSDSFIQAPTDDDNQPESWNPARVAFLILKHPFPQPNVSLSLGLRQRAFRTYELVTQRHNKNIYTEPQPMVQAALLAVALRERLRLTGKWDKLTDELALAPYETWRTPLACLYGLVEKPLELMSALLDPCARSDFYHLAVHAMLSNPLPAGDES